MAVINPLTEEQRQRIIKQLREAANALEQDEEIAIPVEVARWGEPETKLLGCAANATRCNGIDFEHQDAAERRYQREVVEQIG
jgi:hypothetical protein